MADEKVLLTWSVANWVTVLLMAVIGWAIYRFIVQAWAKRRGNNEAT